jgi:predicted secreted acid phosphatase
MMSDAIEEALAITNNCLKEEILDKNNLRKWLDAKEKKHYLYNDGLNILLENHPVFKLKKKKIKNKKHRLVKNTKKYIFFIGDFIPTSVGFRDHSDTEEDVGFSWSVDMSLTANVLRKIKRRENAK